MAGDGDGEVPGLLTLYPSTVLNARLSRNTTVQKPTFVAEERLKLVPGLQRHQPLSRKLTGPGQW